MCVKIVAASKRWSEPHFFFIVNHINYCQRKVQFGQKDITQPMHHVMQVNVLYNQTWEMKISLGTKIHGSLMSTTGKNNKNLKEKLFQNKPKRWKYRATVSMHTTLSHFELNILYTFQKQNKNIRDGIDYNVSSWI